MSDLQAERLRLTALAEPPEGFPECLHQGELEVDHHVQNGLRGGSNAQIHTLFSNIFIAESSSLAVFRTCTCLAVFSVESLESSKVLQQDTVGQCSLVHVHVGKVWQRLGRFCEET